ncbi:MAG TPA: hypothetical protein VNA22_10180 [Pyrinomonadaceae bacterium]|nr:hypothetical protein [Pyrinomonadaceae bacterium]
MKTCPACRRTYDDDGLNFCLEDGSLLTFAPAIDPGAPTVVMNQPRPTNPSPVGEMQTSWDRPGGAYSMQPKKKSRAWIWAVGILGLIVLLCGGGIAGFFIYVANMDTKPIAANSTRPSPTSSSTPKASNNSSNKNTTGDTPNAVSFEPVDLSKYISESSIYGSTEFKDGEFVMSSRSKGYYFVIVTPDDFDTEDSTLRVTVRNPDAADTDLGYGLVFHSDTRPLEKDYAFLIDSVRQRFRVVRHEPGDEVTVTRWTNSKSIKAGAAENTLEARDKDDKIELYINGELASTITNKQGPTSGVPGLYSGDGVRVAFKKLEIAK